MVAGIRKAFFKRQTHAISFVSYYYGCCCYWSWMYFSVCVDFGAVEISISSKKFIWKCIKLVYLTIRMAWLFQVETAIGQKLHEKKRSLSFDRWSYQSLPSHIERESCSLNCIGRLKFFLNFSNLRYFSTAFQCFLSIEVNCNFPKQWMANEGNGDVARIHLHCILETDRKSWQTSFGGCQTAAFLVPSGSLENSEASLFSRLSSNFLPISAIFHVSPAPTPSIPWTFAVSINSNSVPFDCSLSWRKLAGELLRKNSKYANWTELLSSVLLCQTAFREKSRVKSSWVESILVRFTVGRSDHFQS